MGQKSQQQRRFLLKAITASVLAPRIVLGSGVTNPEVVIIGAGVAGLAAAKTLRDKGISFVLVEANFRIGGRVYTDNDIFGVPFDTHAHWMMISRKNPLIDYAKDNGFYIYQDLDKRKYFVGDREATIEYSRLSFSLYSSLNKPELTAISQLLSSFNTSSPFSNLEKLCFNLNYNGFGLK